MKLHFLFTCVILLPLLGFAQYRLNGTIISGDNGHSLPGAHITLMEKNWSAISDAAGKFEFIKLDPGNITLRISYIGYTTTYLPVKVDDNIQLSVKLNPSPYLSDEVIVSASRATHNSPITYSIVDREQLQKNNTGADLPYMLRSTPSVIVNSDAGAGIGYTGIRIRGTDLTRINVTMNGIPVNDPESHSVFFVNMPDLVSSIDNMHIQRGVGSSVNGTAAFGASINIKTDAAQEEAYADLHSGYGSFNTFRNTLRFGTGVQENGLSLDGRLSKISSDGYIDRGWSNLKSYYLAASWQGKSSLVKLIATSGMEKTYQSWYGIPKDSLQTNRRYNPSGEMRDAEGKITGYYDNQTDNYQQDYYQMHLAHRFTRQLFVNASAFLTKGSGYYESWRNNDRLRNYGLPDVQIGNETIQRTDMIRQKWLANDFYGFIAALHYEKPNTGLIVGGGWNRYLGDHFGHIVWARFPSESSPGWRYYDNTGSKTDYSIFLRANKLISNNLNLYLDLQYRSISYAIHGTHDDLRDITQEHNFSFFNPKAGIHYELDKNNSFYIAVGTSNREPNRSVYRDADEGQEIHSEQLVDLEIGHRYRQQRWKIESNIYNMVYKNQLVLTGKINNVGAPILTNVPESYRRGIEVSIHFKPRYNLEVAGNLTLSSNKIANFTEYVDNWNYWNNPETEPYQYVFNLGKTDISFSPAIIAGGSIGYSPVTGASVLFSSNYVGRQYLDNTSNADRSLNPYLVTDLSMAYELKQKLARQILFTLHLNNIFNQLYEANGWVYRYIYDGQSSVMDGYFPQAGFHWMASVKIGI